MADGSPQDSVEVPRGSRGIAVSAACAGSTVTIFRKDLEEDDCQDPNFFDADYSVAGATGFAVWDGAWALIEQLRGDLGDRLRGKRVLELGSGTGLAGLCAAASGAHILLTDIASVTSGMLEPNIVHNAPDGVADGASETAAAASWPGSVPVGSRGGSAAAHALDWFKPVPEDLRPTLHAGLDYVLASEVVWLAELVEPFVTTLVALLELPSRPVGLVVCRERATAASQTFAHLSDVLTLLEENGCSVTLISSQRGPDDEPTSTFEIRRTS